MMATRVISRLLTSILLLLVSSVDISLFPAGKTEIRIGVLAKRGVDKCLSKWSPTAQYLSNTIPEYDFKIVPLKFKTVKSTVQEGKVDFILCNSSFYVEMETEYGISRIVTMKNLREGDIYTKFAGVIFCLSKRKDIRSYYDLKDKVFLAVDRSSFGGWQMAYRELKHMGIDPFRDFKSIRYAGTHDAVVYGVKNGKADAGTVRTEILERMAADGEIDLNNFFVIHEHEGVEHFPFLHSTRSYPEWPFAKVGHISDNLAKKVAAVLINMPADSMAASAAQYAGWTIPSNYQPVHECLKDLKLGPYKDFGKITFRELIRQYLHWILIIFIFLIILSFLISLFVKLNKKLSNSETALKNELSERKKTQKKLKYAHDKLEDRVKERTKELVKINKTLKDEIKEKESLQGQLMQSKKLESIGTLAGGIAHDFNNILTVIGGHTQIAEMSIGTDDPLYENIISIKDACNLAGNLTKQLLTFSRKEVIAPSSMNINDLITNLDKMMRRLIGEDVIMNISLGENIPPILADPGQVEQIIFNLIVNACDAINAKEEMKEEKKIKIKTGHIKTKEEKIPVHLENLKGSYIYISIQDNGIGIANEIREKIFDPFFTRKGIGHGTGLGLATVYGIIKQNSGGIHVDSTPEKGSIFTVYWPSLQKNSNKLSGKKKDKDQLISGNEHILFVEDNADVRNLTAIALEQFGYKVDIAVNGVDAINLIQRENLKFDLLLSDLVMPKMNGIKLAEEIKKLFPDILILFTSGYTEDFESTEILTGPGIDFIRKPYTLSELSQKIRFLLDKNKE
ncbi:MAG: PhnD/SsuA/transferrin family substrate-binding protein [Acidobacteriota bacterium]